MRILLVHGVGHQERPDISVGSPWEEAITAGSSISILHLRQPTSVLTTTSLFLGKINLFTDVGAAAHLGFAAGGAAIEDAAQNVSGWFRPSRGLLDWAKPVAEAADGWHAGMVAEWDQNAPLRAELRKRFDRANQCVQPGCDHGAQSGSVICYDAFSHEDKNACCRALFSDLRLQIANPFLKARISTTRLAASIQKYWFISLNKSDPVLAHRIVDRVPNF